MCPKLIFVSLFIIISISGTQANPPRFGLISGKWCLSDDIQGTQVPNQCGAFDVYETAQESYSFWAISDPPFVEKQSWLQGLTSWFAPSNKSPAEQLMMTYKNLRSSSPLPEFFGRFDGLDYKNPGEIYHNALEEIKADAQHSLLLKFDKTESKLSGVRSTHKLNFWYIRDGVIFTGGFGTTKMPMNTILQNSDPEYPYNRFIDSYEIQMKHNDVIITFTDIVDNPSVIRNALKTILELEKIQPRSEESPSISKPKPNSNDSNNRWNYNDIKKPLLAQSQSTPESQVVRSEERPDNIAERIARTLGRITFEKQKKLLETTNKYYPPPFIFVHQVVDHQHSETA